jgi:hypothetical protein
MSGSQAAPDTAYENSPPRPSASAITYVGFGSSLAGIKAAPGSFRRF